MREIKAYIKPHKLSDVLMVLKAESFVKGVSVSEVRGFGKGTRNNLNDLQEHVKIETVCEDGDVDKIAALIKSKAHTGLIGDGWIFITDVKSTIKI